MTTLFISLVFSFVFMMIIVPFISKLAKNINFLDNPSSDRKIHSTPVPAIGGITIFLTLLVSGLLLWYFIPSIDIQLLSLIGIATPLLITGIVDDKKEINPLIKLIIQFCCAHLLISSGMVQSLYIFNDSQIILHTLQYLFLLFFIVGVTNAFNLMDGIDGLAGSLFLLGFIWIAISAIMSGQLDLLILSLIIIGALIAFLLYNFSTKNKIFMGDGGTLFLSLLLIGMQFLVHKHSAISTPSIANISIIGFIAIISLPTMDALYVFWKRIKNRRSPFYPDRTHLHHKLLKFNSNHSKVTSLILKMILFVFAVSLLLSLLATNISVIIFVVILYSLIYIYLGINASMERHKSILGSIEKNII